MADNDDNGIEGRAPDPFVAARINDPATPAPASFQLSGLLGDSDRAGMRRLYLNTSLDYYVEFRTEDVLTVESVSPDQPPFVGLDATRVTLNRDAQVEYVRSGPAAVPDGFNVDVQAGLPQGFTPDPTDPGGTLPTDFTLPDTFGGCLPDTIPNCIETLLSPCLTRDATCWVTQCNTCGVRCLTRQATCWQTQCATCRTCDDATCQTCLQATCQTCGQATCQTCGQGTCVTCFNGITCRTCNAANCWQTIGNVTCLTCKITNCNNICISQLVPCVTQNRCPTLPCP